MDINMLSRIHGTLLLYLIWEFQYSLAAFWVCNLFAHAESFNEPKPALAVKEILVLIPQIRIIVKHDLALLRIFTTRAY